MTESTREERVQESGVVGHSHDTDDRIGDLDIYEALVNPHDEHSAGGAKGGVGGPMMMPMGGSGAGASPAAGSGAVGTSAAGAGKGTSGASAGVGGAGPGGTSGAGVSGFGGGGLGVSGVGASGVSGIGGAGAGLSGPSSGLGSGAPVAGSGPSWGSPSYGTGAAGITDPRLAVPGTDGGTSSSGGFTVPTVPTTPPTSSPTVPGTGTASPSPIHVPNIGTSPTGGIKAPSIPGGAGGGRTAPSSGGAAGGGGGSLSANTADLGVKTVNASPEMLHKEAQYWDDTSHDFAASVTNPVANLSSSSVDFGMMRDAFIPYNDLLTRLKKLSNQAGMEFSSISDALQSASGGYTDTEATNTRTTTQTGLDRPE